MGQVQFVIANLGPRRTGWVDGAIRRTVIDDQLWSRVEALLLQPNGQRAKRSGPKPLSDRAALSGIVTVLCSGLSWSALPLEYGYGSGVTCWRRLRAWEKSGVWGAVRDLLLAELPKLETQQKSSGKW
jgi:transposase